MTSLTIRGNFKYSWRGIPITVEYTLNPQHFADIETFEKIGEELRRISDYLKKREERQVRRMRNLRRREYAVQFLARLFEEKAT